MHTLLVIDILIVSSFGRIEQTRLQLFAQLLLVLRVIITRLDLVPFQLASQQLTLLHRECLFLLQLLRCKLCKLQLTFQQLHARLEHCSLVTIPFG